MEQTAHKYMRRMNHQLELSLIVLQLFIAYKSFHYKMRKDPTNKSIWSLVTEDFFCDSLAPAIFNAA